LGQAYRGDKFPEIPHSVQGSVEEPYIKSFLHDNYSHAYGALGEVELFGYFKKAHLPCDYEEVLR
jgi:hypothetical protein